jgi:glutamyl-tRNA reductase
MKERGQAFLLLLINCGRKESVLFSKTSLSASYNTNKIQRTIREYLKTYIQINWKNQEEMYRYLNAHDQPKMNERDINHLNRSITKKLKQ